ncbi:MAG: hypothetical protein Kow0037_10450 [Calditrichia bacterium]
MVRWIIAFSVIAFIACSSNKSPKTDYREWVVPLSKIQVILHEDLPDSARTALIRQTLQAHGKTVEEYEALLKEITERSPEKGVALIRGMEEFLKEEMKEVNKPSRTRRPEKNGSEKP